MEGVTMMKIKRLEEVSTEKYKSREREKEKRKEQNGKKKHSHSGRMIKRPGQTKLTCDVYNSDAHVYDPRLCFN